MLSSISDVPSPIEVTSWPQVAALALILAFMAIPSLIGYLTTSRNAREAKNNASAANETVSEVKQTLTENNGGSSIKDYLDRLEAGLTEVRAEQADVRARLETGPATTVQANGLRDTIEQEMPDAPNA